MRKVLPYPIIQNINIPPLIGLGSGYHCTHQHIPITTTVILNNRSLTAADAQRKIDPIRQKTKEATEKKEKANFLKL